MILQPTEQELKDRGFKYLPHDDYYYFIIGEMELIYARGDGRDNYINWWINDEFPLFPTSWDDIDNLIELLTYKK